MRVLQVFDKKDYLNKMKRFVREAVRAVIFKNDEIALVKSHKQGYYKFPGGGIKSGESHIDTLIRETLEETGLNIISDSVRELGMTKEVRKSIFVNEIFEQNSYYYFADISDKKANQKLDRYEKEEGYHLEFIPLINALRANESLTANLDFLNRETYVMRLLYLNGKKIDIGSI